MIWTVFQICGCGREINLDFLLVGSTIILAILDSNVRSRYTAKLACIYKLGDSTN